ncbi:MAG: PAS domain S-box protein, partial [Gammaproteobacteria bacterium]|nr:PAS domain S-box protein [Gammaproteobacteria bacterium]
MAEPNPIHSAPLASRPEVDEVPGSAPEISIESAVVTAVGRSQPTPTSSATDGSPAATQPKGVCADATDATAVLNNKLESLQRPANDLDASAPNDAKSAKLAAKTKARPRKSLALRTRINLLGYALSLGCSIALGLTMLQITAQTLWNNGTHDAHAVAEIVALNSSRTVALKQMDILKARFDSLALFADIRGAVLADPQGEEIIRYVNDDQEWDVKELIADTKRSDQKKIWAMLNGRDWLALETPLIFGQDQVATLYLIWDLSRLQNHLYQLLEASSIAFVVILVLVFLATYQLKKSFSKPVDELLRTTADFAEDGTRAQHAVVFANDEMGKLTESYNAMVDRLVSQHNQLSSAHETLEKRVERRTAQLAAQQVAAESSRKELQRVIDLSLDLLTMINAEGDFIMVSPAVTALLGYSEEQWMACHWEDLMYTPDRVRSGDANIEAKQYLREQGGKVVDAERRMRHRDGHWVWMEWSLTLLDDDGVFMVGRNIQERKKREIEIMVAHKAETIARKRAQQIVDISLDMIVTIDASGRFLQVSRASKRMFGYDPKELLGQRFADFVSNDDFEGNAEKIDSLAAIVAAAGGSVSNVLRRFKHKQGHMVWVEWAVVIQPEEKAIYAVARDMTDRRRQEEELKIAHRKTQDVIDTSRDLITTLNRQGQFLTVSPASKRLLGFEPEEMIGKDIQDYLNSDDIVTSGFDGITKKMKENNGELSGMLRRIKHKKGHWMWMEWNLGSRNDGHEIYATGRDVTDRVQYEHELIAAREAAEHATVAKSDFLSNMSHEIRTPLNGVMGMLQLMDDTEVTVEQRGYLRTALNSSDSLLTLINDILDFSKMEAGKLLLEDEPFSLIELTEDVVALFGERAAAKGINLSGFLEDNVPS